jgi:hypothetical protein
LLIAELLGIQLFYHRNVVLERTSSQSYHHRQLQASVQEIRLLNLKFSSNLRIGKEYTKISSFYKKL